MTIEPHLFRIEVLLSFQRGLWDMVTPTLRGVAVRPAQPVIEARFIYESVGEEERMIASSVEAYVIADFPPPVDVHFAAVPVPSTSPRELLAAEEWVYLRREGDAL